MGGSTITGEPISTLERIFCSPAPEGTAICVLHQVKTPRHDKQRVEPGKGRQQATALDRPGMQNIRLNALKDLSKFQQQARPIRNPGRAQTTTPRDLLDPGWDRAGFRLARPALQPQVKYMVLAICQGR